MGYFVQICTTKPSSFRASLVVLARVTNKRTIACAQIYIMSYVRISPDPLLRFGIMQPMRENLLHVAIFLCISLCKV